MLLVATVWSRIWEEKIEIFPHYSWLATPWRKIVKWRSSTFNTYLACFSCLDCFWSETIFKNLFCYLSRGEWRPYFHSGAGHVVPLQVELTTGIEYFYDSLHGADQRDWRGQRRWGGEGGLAGELESTGKKISSRNSLLQREYCYP